MSTPDPGQGRSTEGTEGMKEAGRETAAAARDMAQSRMEDGKRTAASVASQTSDALDETAASLSARGQEGLAQAAEAMSKRLGLLAEYLEGRSTEDLMREARRLARDNPAMFMAGGVAVGLALSRFFKASPEQSRGDGAWRGPDPSSPTMSHGSTGGGL